jgi:hypothetical protein
MSVVAVTELRNMRLLPAHLRSYKLFKKLQISHILERFKSFHIAHSTGRSFQWYRATCHLQPPAMKVTKAAFLPGKCDSFQDNLDS